MGEPSPVLTHIQRASLARYSLRPHLGRLWIVVLFLLFAAAGFALAACVATVETRPPRVVYVAGPPPPPLVEARGSPAAPGMVWVEGYWHWNGVQYVWIPGHWESPLP